MKLVIFECFDKERAINPIKVDWALLPRAFV